MDLGTFLGRAGVLSAAACAYCAVTGLDDVALVLAVVVLALFVGDSLLVGGRTGNVKKHRRPHLQEPFWRHLDHDAVTKYRLEYQSFRLGSAQGATGETDKLPILTVSDAWERLKRDRFEGNALFQPQVDDDQEVPDEDEDPVEEMQRVVNEWRLAYRQHRQGAAKGAKGDVQMLTSRLAEEQMNLLPTRKLILLRQQMQKQKKMGDKEANRGPGIHVHFGAGRLGLGLIVPVINASKVPFAIVQRPSDEFAALRGKGKQTIRLCLNGVPYTTLTVAEKIADLPSWDTPSDADDNPPRVLVLSSDESMYRKLVGEASTFSTSLGPGIAALGNMLEKIIPVHSEQTPGPVLFAGENDHKAVDALAAQLQSRCTVVSCMVDRICVRREVTEEGIDVIAEPFIGTIVVKPPHDENSFSTEHHVMPKPPFEGDHVLLPALPAQAEYLCTRKLITVNGMHTTLAFMALCQSPLDGSLQLINDKLQEPEASIPLVTLKVASERQKRDIMAWAAARQLLLLYQFGVEVMMLAHNIDESLDDDVRDQILCEILWKYARDCVERFSSTNDTCGRVLGGGVENRFRTRLKPVADFLNSHSRKLDRTSRVLLGIAKVTAPVMRSAVSRLTEAASKVVHGELRESEQKTTAMLPE